MLAFAVDTVALIRDLRPPLELIDEGVGPAQGIGYRCSDSVLDQVCREGGLDPALADGNRGRLPPNATPTELQQRALAHAHFLDNISIFECYKDRCVDVTSVSWCAYSPPQRLLEGGGTTKSTAPNAPTAHASGGVAGRRSDEVLAKDNRVESRDAGRMDRMRTRSASSPLAQEDR